MNLFRMSLTRARQVSYEGSGVQQIGAIRIPHDSYRPLNARGQWTARRPILDLDTAANRPPRGLNYLLDILRLPCRGLILHAHPVSASEPPKRDASKGETA